jgi:hypothetical protein
MNTEPSVDLLLERIELIKLAVEGLALPHDDKRGAVDTVVVALDELEDELEGLLAAQRQQAA